MPAIKKKWMQTKMDDTSGKNESFEEEEKEVLNPEDSTATLIVKKPVKRSVPPGPSMLKGLDGDVLAEKRKRFIPPAEMKLSEWLDNNLETRTEETIHMPILYNYYTELCQASGSDILDVPEFNRMVKTKFGKSFGIQASSIYKTVIKEKKMVEKKKSGGGIKMKEIVIEAINHFGNPWQGVRFFGLKQYIAARFPALQIDAKPKVLKRALEMGTNYGYVELTKGIGMMGSYRLPGAVEPPPKPKTKPKKEGENEVSEGKEGEEDSSSQKEENDGEKEEDDTGKQAETDEAAKEGADGAVAKPKKPKKVQTWSYSKISYGSPARIEDTFPLAITYQSAPKAAGLARIRRYIMEKYGEEVTDSRWRKCLDTGIDKGYWEHISGSGMSGRIHLLMDDFDPSSELLEDRICAAIIACHDPKSASALQIKKYVSQYHPDFGIDARPEKFKKALIRAVEKKMIRQLSGLGASGTFMLVVPFTPSPTVLAGEDDSDDDQDELENEVDTVYVPKGTKSRGMPKVKTMEVISQKKNKTSSAKNTVNNNRGRKLVASPVAAKKIKSGSTKKNKNVSKSNNSSKKRSVRRSPSPLTDEEEELEYTPKKSQSRGGGRGSGGSSRDLSSSSSKAKSSAKKGGKTESLTLSSPKKKDSRKSGGRSSPQKTPSAMVVLSNIDEDYASDEDAMEHTPQKSTSRGRGSSSGGKADRSKQNGTPKSHKKRKADSESGDDLEDNDDDDNNNNSGITYTPRMSAPRGSGGKVESSMSKSPKKRKADSESGDDLEDNADDDSELEYTPRKSASRGGGGKVESSMSKSPKKRKSDIDLDNDDDDLDDYESEKLATPKSRGKGGSGKKKSRR